MNTSDVLKFFVAGALALSVANAAETPAVPAGENPLAQKNASGADAKQAATALIVVRESSAGNLFQAYARDIESAVAEKLAGTQLSTLDFNLVLRRIEERADSSSPAKTDAESAAKEIFCNTSVADLAEMFGANFVVSISLGTLLEETREGVIDGVPVKNFFLSLPGSIELADASGTRILALSGTKGYKISETENARRKISGLERELATNPASILGNALAKAVNAAEPGKIAPASVDFADAEIVCEIEDFSFPQARQNEDGTLSLTTQRVPVGIAGVNLNIDGMDFPLETGVPVRIRLAKNRPHFVLISSDKLRSVKRTIRVSENGQKIRFALSPSEEMRASIVRDLAELIAIEEAIKAGKRSDVLTDAEAERLRGKAEAWKKSEIKFPEQTVIVPGVPFPQTVPAGREKIA